MLIFSHFDQLHLTFSFAKCNRHTKAIGTLKFLDSVWDNWPGNKSYMSLNDFNPATPSSDFSGSVSFGFGSSFSVVSCRWKEPTNWIENFRMIALLMRAISTLDFFLKSFVNIQKWHELHTFTTSTHYYLNCYCSAAVMIETQLLLTFDKPISWYCWKYWANIVCSTISFIKFDPAIEYCTNNQKQPTDGDFKHHGRFRAASWLALP